jgi:hypothetical protein
MLQAGWQPFPIVCCQGHEKLELLFQVWRFHQKSHLFEKA